MGGYYGGEGGEIEEGGKIEEGGEIEEEGVFL